MAEILNDLAVTTIDIPKSVAGQDQSTAMITTARDLLTASY
jgi:hypothetical protein